MKNLFLILMILLTVSCTKSTITPQDQPKPQKATIQMAPISTIGTAVSVGNGYYYLPMIVDNFTGITAISLVVVFDASTVELIGLRNWSGLNNLMWNCENGELRIGAYTSPPGISFENGKTLFTFVFHKKGVEGSPVKFLDEPTTYCEYADKFINELNDTPYDTYYHNGVIY